jgi:phosphate transport system permease protein
MAEATIRTMPRAGKPARSLILSKRASRFQRLCALAGQGILLLITSGSLFAVLFMFYFVAADAVPFFRDTAATKEFFSSTRWYPSGSPPEFGAMAIFFGSFMVTAGAAAVAVPLGVFAALCLSDILPFALRQLAKPVIEILAAIPSVAYGFFALVIFAPLLQEQGGSLLRLGTWIIGLPLALLAAMIVSDLATARCRPRWRWPVRIGVGLLLALAGAALLMLVAGRLGQVKISSGTNALNVSVILGIMSLPTVVSVSEDALQAVGRELREGSYALGATRAETLLRVVLPAAASGIGAAVILGVMRAVGETMVVWMASGNAAHVPDPFWNFLEPVRTLTATIAGDMGEADQVTGSARFHVLFVMALCLLAISFSLNLISQWAVSRTQQRLRGQ